MATPTFAPVLEAVRGLSWPARRKARNAVPGAHVALTQRTSAELAEFRSYRQGDDPGSIDWKLLARSDRVYVRLAPEHALLPTVVVLDASGSMAFPGDTLAKWELARRLALALAAIARADGDPVGLLVVGHGGVRWIAPRSRRSVLEEMIRALELTPEGSTPLAPAIVPVLRRTARVALITDFLGDADALLGLGRRFAAAGGALHAVHLVDQAELEPATGTLLCTDPEHPELRRPLPPAARAEYRRQFDGWRLGLARAWRGAGARYTEVVTGAESLRHALRRITTLPGALGGAR